MTSTYTPLVGFAFPGALEIVDGRRTTQYAVEPIQSDWGNAFRLTKTAGAGSDPTERVYEVCVTADGMGDSCSCKGFARYQRCRHVQALAAAIEEGGL